KPADAIPGIHPSKDGRWVGLWVTTGQQWLDFCTLVGRQDWLDDPSLALMDNRALRSDELVALVGEWNIARTADEIVELASLFRLPVAEVTDGERLPQQDHFAERRFYTKNPR